jgi:hypothetical protein
MVFSNSDGQAGGLKELSAIKYPGRRRQIKEFKLSEGMLLH